MNINIEISNILNKNLIKYINNQSKLDINYFLNIILQLGFSNYNHLLNYSNLYDNNNDINNKIDTNILSIINEIRDNTCKITNLFNKSNNKGVCGENIIKYTFNKYFSNYILTDVSKQNHSGDFHLLLTDINELILIESKFYTNIVDQKEINKLYYDMKNSGINYSLLLSISSNITNKNNDIEWEINNDQIIIFISNINNNYNKIILGLTILKTLISLVKKNKHINIQNFSQNSYNKILFYINDIINLKNNIIKIKNNINNIHNNISSQILELYNMVTILDNEFTQKINILQYSINNEFKSINVNTNNTDLEYIYIMIDNFNNSNIKKLLHLIVSDFYSNNFYILTNWCFYKNNNDKCIGKICILKSTLNINLNNDIQLKNIKTTNWNNIFKFLLSLT